MENGKSKETFKILWLGDLFEKIRLAIPKEEASNEEIKKMLLEVYENRHLSNGRFFNNLNSDNSIMTQEQFINYFLNSGYVLSGYSCLYKNQNEVDSITSAALNFLLSTRKVYKKKMNEVERGTLLYFYYKILQLTYKRLANSFYGILGERNSIFYNSFLQNSITLTGQDLITTSIVSLENFLSDNIYFKDSDDLLSFINTLKKEKAETNILDYVDVISRERLLSYFIEKTRGKVNNDIYERVVDNLTDEERTKAYYKNRILDFCSQPKITSKLKSLLRFDLVGEEPADEIKDEFNEFKKIILDFCFLDQLFEDRYRRAVKDTRKSIVTIDTDLTEMFGSSRSRGLEANSVNCWKAEMLISS